MTLYDGKEMKMTRDDGGPAFPFTHGPGGAEGGMSLRDYAAIKALPIAVGKTQEPDFSCWGGRAAAGSHAHQEELARWRKRLASEAYAIADAMLTARAKAEGSTP